MVKYVGNPNFKHDAPGKIGVLVTNLGTPDAPHPAALRAYLAEFLSDPRVIEVPRPIWWFILHGIILRLRPKRSAKAYRQIWTDEGSPLLSISKKQAQAIGSALNEAHDGDIHVELGMRYGSPSIPSALHNLQQLNVQKLLIFPLYPQYSAATTASTFDAVSAVLRTWRWLPELRMSRHYHDDAHYIDAIVESIRIQWAKSSKPERLLFSFHGLPRHYFLAGDPYFCECHKTARLVADKLALNEDQWHVSFQSRFGPREWLKPYTDKLLQQWGKAGIEDVHIICPGFAADCLETLEEIQIQNRALFLTAGGKAFHYIPALNDGPSHITALCKIIEKHMQGWTDETADLPQRVKYAMDKGAQQ